MSGLHEPVVVGVAPLPLEDVVRVAVDRAPVRLAPQAREALLRGRQAVEQLLRRRAVVYGVTTGFGRFADVAIPPEQVRELQRNLVRSHCAGVGEPLDAAAVRAMMLLRAHALARGHSGVRPEVVERLLDLLNAGVHPVVPALGSVGASGDLQPLAHVAAVLIGEGEAELGGQVLPAAEALARVGLVPLVLEAKEGLALINGTQAMTAVGVLALTQAEVLARSADAVAALTCEVLRGIPDAFDARLQALRPHPGPARVAANLRRLLAGSRLTTRPGELRTQDAYSLRCIPPVHGAFRHAVDFCRGVLTVEVDAVTDNPLLFSDDPEPGEVTVLSGGNFHGQPVAQAMDLLALAAADLAAVSERRVERLLNPALGGLPPFLTRQAGLHSGLMIAQYTAAALVTELKTLAFPASVDSIPTSAGQEDHVSMGMLAARKARRAVELLAHVLAVEWLCAAQAADLLDPEALSPAGRAVHACAREVVPALWEDRPPAPDLAALARRLREGVLLAAVERVVGPLA